MTRDASGQDSLLCQTRALGQKDLKARSCRPKKLECCLSQGVRTDILRKLGKLIDVFTSVPAAGDTETKIKVKVFQQAFPEVVPLDHPEV